MLLLLLIDSMSFLMRKMMTVILNIDVNVLQKKKNNNNNKKKIVVVNVVMGMIQIMDPVNIIVPMMIEDLPVTIIIEVEVVVEVEEVVVVVIS
jgi:hypothetical protein